MSTTASVLPERNNRPRKAYRQIARLLNEQNMLASRLSYRDIAAHKREYLVRFDDEENVAGCVRLQQALWYLWEVSHVSVSPKHQRMGVATSLLDQAEAKAAMYGATVMQCTVRVGNVASESLFRKRGYIPTVTFRNPSTGRNVTVFQKVLVPATAVAEEAEA